MSGLVGNSRRHVLTCRGSFVNIPDSKGLQSGDGKFRPNSSSATGSCVKERTSNHDVVVEQA